VIGRKEKRLDENRTIKPSYNAPLEALAGFTALIGGNKIVLAETARLVTP
jgi:hypothetical protein